MNQVQIPTVAENVAEKGVERKDPRLAMTLAEALQAELDKNLDRAERLKIAISKAPVRLLEMKLEDLRKSGLEFEPWWIRVGH